MNKPIYSHLLHIAVIIILATLYFVLPEYHSGNLARIFVLAAYAMGYNLLFGYTGLLSLGHALFFATGMYGLGLSMHLFNLPVIPSFIIGLIASAGVSTIIGFLALRTSGVAFMIVTLMFAQAGFLTILLAGKYTRGDEGFVLPQADRAIGAIDLSQSDSRYFAALLLFSTVLLIIGWLVQSRFGKTLVAIRENPERARMLGYDIQRHKLYAIILSGIFSGAAGAAYALLFGYAGATFASVQYSIYPLLWVLLGGAGTTIGPLIGTVFMEYLIFISSRFTDAYMLIAGITLIILTLFVPLGLIGTLRKKIFRWLP